MFSSDASIFLRSEGMLKCALCRKKLANNESKDLLELQPIQGSDFLKYNVLYISVYEHCVCSYNTSK